MIHNNFSSLVSLQEKAVMVSLTANMFSCRETSCSEPESSRDTEMCRSPFQNHKSVFERIHFKINTFGKHPEKDAFRGGREE